MESSLAQRDLIDVMTSNDAVALDTKIWTVQEQATDTVKAEVLLRKNNRKAAGILLNSIKTDTEEGKGAFNIVDKFIDANAGYAGGQFKKAWAALARVYEDTDLITVSELKKKYGNFQMRDDEKPHVFITKMDLARTELKEKSAKEVVSDVTFINDVLARLPVGHDSSQLGPYQQTRKTIEDKIAQRIEDGKQAYSVNDLQKELERTHQDLFGRDADEEYPRDRKPAEAGFAGFGPFKGKCHKCGVYGHMASKCRAGGNRGSFQSGRGGRGGRGRFGGRGRGGGRSGGFAGNCFYCGMIGHTKRDCRKLKADQTAGTVHSDAGHRASDRSGRGRNEGRRHNEEVAFMVTEEEFCNEDVESEEEDSCDGFFDNFENCKASSKWSKQAADDADLCYYIDTTGDDVVDREEWYYDVGDADADAVAITDVVAEPSESTMVIEAETEIKALVNIEEKVETGEACFRLQESVRVLSTKRSTNQNTNLICVDRTPKMCQSKSQRLNLNAMKKDIRQARRETISPPYNVSATKANIKSKKSKPVRQGPSQTGYKISTAGTAAWKRNGRNGPKRAIPNRRLARSNRRATRPKRDSTTSHDSCEFVKVPVRNRNSSICRKSIDNDDVSSTSSTASSDSNYYSCLEEEAEEEDDEEPSAFCLTGACTCSASHKNCQAQEVKEEFVDEWYVNNYHGSKKKKPPKEHFNLRPRTGVVDDFGYTPMYPVRDTSWNAYKKNKTPILWELEQFLWDAHEESDKQLRDRSYHPRSWRWEPSPALREERLHRRINAWNLKIPRTNGYHNRKRKDTRDTRKYYKQVQHERTLLCDRLSNRNRKVNKARRDRRFRNRKGRDKVRCQVFRHLHCDSNLPEDVLRHINAFTGSSTSKCEEAIKYVRSENARTTAKSKAKQMRTEMVERRKMERLFDLIYDELGVQRTSDEERLGMPKLEDEICMMAGYSFNRDTWLADSGASTHMGNSDEGMYEIEEIDSPVTIGDGKSLRATKVGKLRRTVVQADGKTMDVILPDYKCVPELQMNLFSLMKAIASGWQLTNDGVKIAVTKDKHTVVFDRIYKTDNGVLCGVEILPRMETAEMAAAGIGHGKHWDINRLHRVFNHAAEETLRATAKAYDWTVTGVFEACTECQISNIKKKGVPKDGTEDKSTTPGERIFLDTTSIKIRSFGGSKFWLVIVDDATSFTWSIFLKTKSEQVPRLMTFVRKMKARGTPVKKIRCDNAGENKSLQAACLAAGDPDVVNIVFEFTPRDSPEYNGKAERKIAVLHSRNRVMLNAAHLSKKLHDSLWAESGATVTDVENLLLSRTKEEPAHKAFYKCEMPEADKLRQFGEIAVIKHGPSIKGKLADRGIPMMYLGRAKDHAADTHRFLHLGTSRIYTSRDAIWMNKVYGEYKGLHLPSLTDMTTTVPEKIKAAEDEEPPAAAVLPPPPLVEQPPPVEAVVRYRTRAQGAAQQTPTLGTVDSRILNAMKKLDSSANPVAQSIVERAKALANPDPQSGREEPAPDDSNAFIMDACGLIDRFGFEFGDLADDLAMSAVETGDYSKMDPTKYKEIFDNPKNWDEGWNHPEPFQQQHWRAAIMEEFAKMETRKVWRKFRRSDIPAGRRCVKHKWVLEIKRDGRFRARLVACGYSQVPGVDFTEVYSPVANDVSFRIVVICIILWGLESLIFDVETAFLHGDLKEEIFMDCPDGMEHDEGECLLLLQTIYGLVQSARMFFAKFKGILCDKMGFQQCQSDPCLFLRRNQLGVCIILVHVDDAFTTGTRAAIDSVVSEIKSHGLNVTVEHKLTDYLSSEIRFSTDKKRAWIGQPHMIKKIRKIFGEEVKHMQKYKTPGTPGLNIVRPKEEGDKISKEDQSRYRTGVGMLLYLIKQSRPEIANAVRELAKVLDGASPAAYKEMLRVINYVLGTEGIGLKIKPTAPTKGLWRIVLYTDSDWAGDKDDRRSISGFMLFLNGVLICWRSRSQRIVSLSSSEAEFYACSEAVKEIPFIVQILLFLGIPVELPIIVQVDNIGAIFMSENLTSSARTRHMDTRYHFVNDYQSDGLIKLMFVPSAQNISDLATKNVSGEILEAHGPSFLLEKKDLDSLD